MTAERPGLRRRALLALAPRAGGGWLRIIRATSQLRRYGDEAALPTDGGPVIYCFWHSQLAMMPWMQLRPPTVVPISRSDDGEITARLFSRLRCEVVRGSSSRGGAIAARVLLRAIREGRDLAITPDGPRGPAEVAQAGAVWLGRASGRPLLPVAYASRPSLRLRTWDRMRFPLPLSRGLFVYGSHLGVARHASPEDLQEASRELTRRLVELTERAERMLLR